MTDRIKTWACVVVALVVFVGTACGQTTPSSPSPGDSKAESQPEAQIGVEQAVRQALDIIDRLSLTGDGELDPADVEELGNLTAIVQAQDPGHPRLLFLRGGLLMYSGRDADAINELQRFVDTHLGQAEWKAYRMSGDLLVNEFPSLAKAKYRKAEALMPSEPRVLFGLSRCELKLGDREEALSLAKRALDAAPTNHPLRRQFLNHVAYLLRAEGQFEEAQNTVLLALEVAKREYENDMASTRKLAVLDSLYQQTLQTISARIEAGQATPRQFSELVQYAHEAAAVRNKIALNQALTILELAMSSFPDGGSQLILEERAGLLVDLGRTAEAKQAYTSILERFPNSQRAKDYLKADSPDAASDAQGG